MKCRQTGAAGNRTFTAQPGPGGFGADERLRPGNIASRSVLDIRHTAECPQTPLARRIADLTAASAWARGICGRLGGPAARSDGDESSRDGAGSGRDEAGSSNGECLRISLRAAALCEIAERTLRDLHNTISALSDCVADAEAAGCSVDADWVVTGDRDGDAGEWAEIIAAAVTTVSTADQRSREASRAAATALLDMANVLEPNIGIGAVAWTDSPLTEVTDGPGHGW